MADGIDITRRTLLCWLAPACGGCLGAAPAAEGLRAWLASGRIHVAAPQLRFVTGNPLERLRTGAPVPYALQLSLSTDRWATTLLRDIERFVFSYDLWEEKFSVTKLGRPRKTVSHLDARAAEGFCVDEMTLEPAGIAERQPFWLRLEARAENPGEQPFDSDSGMTLTRLVELFSRRARRDQARWEADAGPLQLAELRSAPGVRR